MKAAKCSKAQFPGGSKKPRAMFSPRQLYMLDEFFTANNFPKAKEREEIASKLQICPHSVQVTSLEDIMGQLPQLSINWLGEHSKCTCSYVIIALTLICACAWYHGSDHK